MSLIFSVPGKTFLAGEYLALQGGPALVFLSQPCFELEAKPGKGNVEAVHPDSPAGLFIRKHTDYFSHYDLTFRDPYQGKGGFGASTAQFLSAFAFWLYKTSQQQDMEKVLDLKHLLEEYYQVAWNGEGQRPSGADLVGQFKGSMTFFEKRKGLIAVKSWPFDDLEFFLLHTGNKVATHEHLKSIKDFDASSLEKSFNLIKESFEIGNSEHFVQGIDSYANDLKDLGFTCKETLQILEEMRKVPGVRAAKGCGALGADVILAVTQKNQTEDFGKFCAAHHLPILSSVDKISLGLQVRGTL